MNKVHFWLIGFGVSVIAAEYFMGFPYGRVGIGIPGSAIVLGIRQWFMAGSRAERAVGAISSKHGGAGYGKYHYHDIV